MRRKSNNDWSLIAQVYPPKAIRAKADFNQLDSAESISRKSIHIAYAFFRPKAII